MKRRQFIRIVGLGLASTAIGSSIVSCSDNKQAVEFGWGTASLEQSDIRLKLIALAMLCPNPHNIQPWLIKMTSDTSFDLYVDQTRLLPQTDPVARQIHIGQGTFLETLSIAASGHGYQAEISYFPEGEYSNQETLEKPVASITLVKQDTTVVDELYPYLLERQSNKREYNNHRLSETEKSKLGAFNLRSNEGKPVSQLLFIDKPEASQYMQEVLTKAMAIEVSNKQRDLETIALFRFNDAEIAKYRDGFGLAHSGVTGFKKIVAETLFLSRKSAEKDSTAFGEQSVQFTKTVSESTASFALLSSPGNSRQQQVQVGREYCRLNLTSTKMGIAQHPMSQVLQEYQDMLPLQEDFKQYFSIPENHTVQMLVRLGHAAKTAHTPRRAVASIVKA
ncbi:twin-arginine translocation pathway signal protein [Alginatibacterium sediminis]|uniref:Twin-arginine translocation pathway signal protein n=1 Tax=Alginatibacterium sediminis TaxID=2164068 RepID=A0A420EA38_9ALTE|nr:twin-arginine translocation pathway signal protein [Alginatibacterium sediminis]RKF17539.1 twin-arginine translocation pathway signal protein [Alginatibacterium sediminis]